jgi:hypothetical protein
VGERLALAPAQRSLMAHDTAHAPVQAPTGSCAPCTGYRATCETAQARADFPRETLVLATARGFAIRAGCSIGVLSNSGEHLSRACGRRTTHERLRSRNSRHLQCCPFWCLRGLPAARHYPRGTGRGAPAVRGADAVTCERVSRTNWWPRNYGWIGHKSSSGFSDLAPAMLHYNWF